MAGDWEFCVQILSGSQFVYFCYNHLMQQQLAKQNALLKVYIATLEQQVRANGQERQALAQEISTITSDNLNLNRRISLQPQAKLHQLIDLQEKLQKQAEVNANLKNEVDTVYLKLQDMSQLLKETTVKKEELQASIKERQRLEKKYEIALKELQKERCDKKRISLQNDQFSIKIKHLVAGLEQHNDIVEHLESLKKTRLELEAKVFTFEAEQSKLHAEIAEQKAKIVRLERQNEAYRRRLQESESSLAHFKAKKEADLQISNKWAQERRQLIERIQQIEDQNQRLSQDNQQLTETLQSSRQQVEDLTTEIKQFVTVKMQSKHKNRTQSPCQQYEFTSAFKQLRFQIQAIKENQPKSPIPVHHTHSRQNSKESLLFEPNSPSKWKSIEGKLSILRNTQSMSRFK